MLAYDPKYRAEADTKEFGTTAFLTPQEIGDLSSRSRPQSDAIAYFMMASMAFASTATASTVPAAIRSD
jgi:hypothetical protein